MLRVGIIIDISLFSHFARSGCARMPEGNRIISDEFSKIFFSVNIHESFPDDVALAAIEASLCWFPIIIIIIIIIIIKQENNEWRIVTLKSGLWVIQGHWKWHYSIDRIRDPIDVT